MRILALGGRVMPVIVKSALPRKLFVVFSWLWARFPPQILCVISVDTHFVWGEVKHHQC